MMTAPLEMTERILWSLRKISRAIHLHSRALMLQCGLTGPQLIVLRQLNRDGQVPIGCLARSVSLSQATVTGIVERLANRGYVERTRDPIDRRRMLVRCTAAGRNTAEVAPPLLQERFTEQLGKLEDWEQHMLLSTLLRVGSMMQADRVDEQVIAAALGTPDDPLPDVLEAPLAVGLEEPLEIDAADTT
ncbi:MAG: MarR family winged helix-turn-helix transcriptional regulator [Acidobacteriota bacterium]